MRLCALHPDSTLLLRVAPGSSLRCGPAAPLRRQERARPHGARRRSDAKLVAVTAARALVPRQGLQSFMPISERRNPCAVLVKVNMRSPQKMK